MNHAPDVAAKRTEVGVIGDAHLHSFFWTGSLSPAQPPVMGADSVLAELRGSRNKNANIPQTWPDTTTMSDMDLFENVVEASTESRLDSNTSIHIGSLIESIPASIVDNTPEFRVLPSGGNEAAHPSLMLPLEVDTHILSTDYQGPDASNTVWGGHFRPPSLETTYQDFFQQGYTGGCTNPGLTSWERKIIDNVASNTTHTVSTSRSESWSAPVDGRKGECLCSRACQLSPYIGTLHPGASGDVQPINQQPLTESLSYGPNRRQRHSLRQRSLQPLRILVSDTISSSPSP
ncbi:hypothetical protein FRC16_007361 [Serendipita sp. 398]|nr:hypothetical protein FRC16_007361 [Serendipita sp. 398]